jgi:preprotein translocase subunit SecA
VLNARHGADEAQRLQHAGEAGAITVTTVIAGRGTDLAISAEGLTAGGLHVIRTAPGRSERLDRQLLGRTARNGGPGSTEAIVCVPTRLPAPCAHAIVDVLRRTQSLHDLYERWQRVREDRRQQSALAYTRGAV